MKEEKNIIPNPFDEIEKNAYYNEDNFKESKLLIAVRKKKMEKTNIILIFIFIGLMIGYYLLNIPYINIVAYILILKITYNFTEFESYYKGFVEGYGNARGIKINKN